MLYEDWRIHKRLNDYKTVYVYCRRGPGKPLIELNTILDLKDQGYSVVINNGFKENKYGKRRAFK